MKKIAVDILRRKYMGRLIDLTGQVFGKLTVLEQDKKKSKE